MPLHFTYFWRRLQCKKGRFTDRSSETDLVAIFMYAVVTERERERETQKIFIHIQPTFQSRHPRRRFTTKSRKACHYNNENDYHCSFIWSLALLLNLVQTYISCTFLACLYSLYKAYKLFVGISLMGFAFPLCSFFLADAHGMLWKRRTSQTVSKMSRDMYLYALRLLLQHKLLGCQVDLGISYILILHRKRELYTRWKQNCLHFMNDLYQNINCTGMMKEECTAWYILTVKWQKKICIRVQDTTI